MAYILYVNRSARSVRVHRDSCTHLRKHGGISRTASALRVLHRGPRHLRAGLGARQMAVHAHHASAPVPPESRRYVPPVQPECRVDDVRHLGVLLVADFVVGCWPQYRCLLLWRGQSRNGLPDEQRFQLEAGGSFYLSPLAPDSRLCRVREGWRRSRPYDPLDCSCVGPDGEITC